MKKEKTSFFINISKFKKIISSIIIIIFSSMILFTILFIFSVTENNNVLKWVTFSLSTFYCYLILILYFANINLFKYTFKISKFNLLIHSKEKSDLPILLILCQILLLQIGNFWLFQDLVKSPFAIETYNFIIGIIFTTIYVSVFTDMISRFSKLSRDTYKIKFCLDNDINIMDEFDIKDNIKLILKKNKGTKQNIDDFKEELSAWIEFEKSENDKFNKKRLIKVLNSIIE